MRGHRHEFYEEQQRAPIIYLPIGAPEEHGLQSVLAVDPWTTYEICLRAAALSQGIVFPIVPIAPAGHPSWSREELRRRAADAAPPSCFVSREVCKSLYIELMESLADLGFKSCIAFSGHFPGDVLLEEIEKEQGGVIRGMRFWGGGLVRILKDELKRMDEEHPLWGGHGTMWETSMLRALNEQWVDFSRVDHIQESAISHQLKDLSPEKIQAIKLANVEFGNRYLTAKIDSPGGFFKQHFLNFLPLPHGQGALRPVFPSADDSIVGSSSCPCDLWVRRPRAASLQERIQR